MDFPPLVNAAGWGEVCHLLSGARLHTQRAKKEPSAGVIPGDGSFVYGRLKEPTLMKRHRSRKTWAR